MIKNIFITFLFISCQIVDNNVFENNEYYIEYPADMEFDSGGQNGISFILKTSKESSNDIFIENLNLVINNVGNASLEQIKKGAKKDLEGLAKIIEEKDTILNNKNCFRMIFEIIQNGTQFKVLQHYFVSNNKVYLLTFTSEANKFNKFYQKMKKVLLSFKIK